MNLLENLAVKFFLIWPITKFYFICCVLAQIPYLGKSGSWAMGQNALGQLDYKIFKSTISLEQNDENGYFLHFETNSWKLKTDWKYMWGGRGQK